MAKNNMPHQEVSPKTIPFVANLVQQYEFLKQLAMQMGIGSLENIQTARVTEIQQ